MHAQNDRVSPWVLPVIVFSQFGCTSLWFAVNAVMPELQSVYLLPAHAMGHLTSSVQFGFIIGTLLFAILTLADRFSPVRVFFTCAVIGAAFNLTLLFPFQTFYSLLSIRFVIGVCLAGIYPVGMKIAADYYQQGLGKSLGFLVGALVLGTAFPHALKGFGLALPWQGVLWITSGLAVAGGTMIYILGDGPYRTPSMGFNPTALLTVFKKSSFRKAAFGYFGHMWELYAFWAFVPVILANYVRSVNTSFWAFIIIGMGSLSCVAAGYLSVKKDTRKVASWALFISAGCCAGSFLILPLHLDWLKLVFLVVWGITVIMDSPMFSTLIAQNAPVENKGTSLTIVNSIGFLITIFSIQLLNTLVSYSGSPAVYVALVIGPILGLIGLLWS